MLHNGGWESLQKVPILIVVCVLSVSGEVYLNDTSIIDCHIRNSITGQRPISEFQSDRSVTHPHPLTSI